MPSSGLIKYLFIAEVLFVPFFDALLFHVYFMRIESCNVACLVSF